MSAQYLIDSEAQHRIAEYIKVLLPVTENRDVLVGGILELIRGELETMVQMEGQEKEHKVVEKNRYSIFNDSSIAGVIDNVRENKPNFREKINFTLLSHDGGKLDVQLMIENVDARGLSALLSIIRN